MIQEDGLRRNGFPDAGQGHRKSDGAFPMRDNANGILKRPSRRGTPPTEIQDGFPDAGNGQIKMKSGFPDTGQGY